MLRCILACDLLGGVVVRGVRGERDRYRPIGEYSRIVSTSDPDEMIAAMRPRETYVADLDRITGRGDSLPIITRLSKLTRVMADAGVSRREDVGQVRAAARSVILGTETAPLALIRECQGPDVVVSVDMKGGRMMARDPALDLPPLEVVKLLDGLELGGLILLDVARVGSGEGVDFGLLEAAAAASRHDVIAGGGVRGPEDLDRVRDAGGAGAIVASAVHAGAIPLKTLR